MNGSLSVLEVDDALSERMMRAASHAPAACFQCGTCAATCPVLSGEGRRVSARMILRRAQLGVPGGEDDGLWACTACRSCEVRCPRDVHIVEAVMGMRGVSLSDGKAPPEFHRLLWSTLEEGNPGNHPRSRRADWAKGSGLPAPGGTHKLLLYAGCAAAYDERIQRTARAAARLLVSSGVDVGWLGAAEKCCGDAVRSTGERGHLERLVAANVAAFNATGAERVVALSPHCFDIMRNLYPRYGLRAEVVHSTQLFSELVDAGRLVSPRRVDATVAYHDPCYLGRYNGVYEEPRKILESIPGLKVVEMRDSKDSALCCGGGGGGMWRREEGERLSDKRHAQAASTGAEILATACPYCIENFEDATKRLGGPAVLDVVELLSPAGGA
ncbi:MAG: (Fe-S)-binding protein [Euryarchaeota archaeon]|nr:(Fe-S)-binding protein [Euryarchaeota archaeon]